LSNLQGTTDSSQERQGDIMHWLLAILQVVNAGGRLAPHKAIQKQVQELVDTYGSDRVWEAIKQFSTTFDMADASIVEVLFHRYPELPSVLKSEEGQTALSQWFEQNLAIVSQTHQLFYGLAKLVPPSTTTRFAQGEVTLEQREVLGKVSQILGKENNNNEESGNLHPGL